MDDSYLPDCPLCQHNQRVEKVSRVVEKAFAARPASKEKFSRVVWSGKTYYIKDSLVKLPQNPLVWSDLFIGGPSLHKLRRGLVKWHLTAQVYAIRHGTAKPEAYDQPDQVTALLLLPIVENPGPLLRTSFWRFLKEIILFRAYWWVAALVVFLIGLIGNNVWLALAGMLLLQALFLIALFGAIVCKLLLAVLREGERDYQEKRRTLASAEDKWNRLYYCGQHDGIFLPEPDSPFIYLKDMPDYLFKSVTKEVV